MATSDGAPAATLRDEARQWAEWLAGPDNHYGMTPDEEKGAMYVLALLDVIDLAATPGKWDEFLTVIGADNGR